MDERKSSIKIAKREYGTSPGTLLHALVSLSQAKKKMINGGPKVRK